MTTNNEQLCQLLSDFETWQDGDALNERRLVQHDLVLAHLARLYGGLSWNAQHFGLLPLSSLTVEIEEQKPVALSHLLAVTATGKLLVCASVPIPECDNPIENKGLFAIARPLKLPETLQKTWPDFPLYQVKLVWRAWEVGIDEIVKTGEGLPLGRLKEGEWDADYIPPVMRLATDERLRQQATEVMNQLSSVASGDSRVAEQVLALQQSDLGNMTPLAFWQAHCRCLVGLKNHPKLADDADYRAKVASLVSSCESGLWEKEESLLPLGLIWKDIEKRLAKESERQKGMVQLMTRVNQLASRDNQVADFVLPLQQTDWTTETPLAFWQAHCRCLVGLKDHPKLADDADYQDSVSKLLSETFSPLVIGDGLEPLRLAWQRVEQGLDKKEKPAPKPRRYVSLAWYATSMVGMVLLAILMLFQLKADFEKQLAALDNKQAETAKKLSEQFTNVENKLNEIKEFAKTHHHKLKELKKSEAFRDTLKDGTLGPEMIVIPAGTFRMGDIQGGGNSREQPVHEVSIKSFAMGRYEITFAEYDKFAEATGREKPDDESWGRGKRPVINVSWLDVTIYAEWLSRQTGQQYRLPTEAQWEYAARAGTSTKYWWGNEVGSNKANCSNCGDRFEYSAPVGSFAANPFGLYDTVGNVWEWTCSEYENAYKGQEKYCLSKEDSTKDSLFVLRGGSWFNSAMRMRSADRLSNPRTNRYRDVGVRLARIL